MRRGLYLIGRGVIPSCFHLEYQKLILKRALENLCLRSRGYLSLGGPCRHVSCCVHLSHVHLWSSGYDVSLTR